MATNCDDTVLIKVLEFYSGIGGMHYALRESGVPFDVLGAFDINTNANAVYKHNFPDSKLLQKNLEGLSVQDLDRFSAQCWTMSPPCQPYTRQGKQEASKDARARSFLHILDLFEQMETPPTYILIENVKGFEESDTRQRLVNVLQTRGYHFKEFLVSPADFGVPNSRLRFYLLAKPVSNSFKEDLVVNNSLSPSLIVSTRQTKQLVGQYLDDQQDLQYLLPDDVLLRFNDVMDIVHQDSKGSCCFTKAYGKYVKGTGSVYTPMTREDVDNVYKRIKEVGNGYEEQEKLQLLKTLRLRYFSPTEISKIMCFPDDFSFPDEMSVRQRYQLLGNSVNVRVIAHLLKEILFNS